MEKTQDESTQHRILADRFLPAGSTIATSQPFVHVLMQKENDIRCGECFNGSETLLKCTACSVVKYCNRNCQKKAWKYHKIECKGYQKINPLLPKDNMLLLLRILIQLKASAMESEEFCGVKRTFDDLMSHMELMREDKVSREEFSQILKALHVFTSGIFDLPEENELFEIFGKMVINTFSICDGEMQAIGSGLYLGPSGLNHSCSSNSVAIFDGTKLILRAIESINPQEEIQISYIDPLNTTNERRCELKSRYYFECHCKSCEDSNREALMKAAGCCSGTSYSFNDAKDVIEKAKILKANQDGDGVIKTCLDYLPDGDSKTCTNIHHVMIRDLLFDAYIDSSRWKDAVNIGIQITTTYRLYLSEYHPTLGIHLMKLGKIQLFIQELSEALESLKQAEKILRITHGTSHYMYRDLISLLNQCSEELQR